MIFSYIYIPPKSLETILLVYKEKVTFTCDFSYVGLMSVNVSLSFFVDASSVKYKYTGKKYIKPRMHILHISHDSIK